MCSGGGDKQLKCWEFELIVPPTQQSDHSAINKRQLSLVLSRTVQLTDDVLCVRHSPDGRYIACGLLDSTIKIFHSDTLKFFLSLYGHKLPVLCIDISSDSSLLVSGSADKSVKIWGLDFGDLHRSIHAHNDSIMKISFQSNTHYFISASKDKLVKQWDGDTFQFIQCIGSHSSEVWSMCVSVDGDICVSGGNDKAIKIWKQTDEQLFIDEERQREYEQQLDSQKQSNSQIGIIDQSNLLPSNTVQPVHNNKHLVAADVSTVDASEKLIEAMDLAASEEQRWQAYHNELAANKLSMKNIDILSPPPNPLLRSLTSSQYVHNVLTSIPSTELDSAITVLPYDYAIKLITYLDRYIAQSHNVELAVHCMLYLLSMHSMQIVTNHTMYNQLLQLQQHTQLSINNMTDTIGYNMAALKYIQRAIDDQSNQFVFDEKQQLPKKPKISLQ